MKQVAGQLRLGLAQYREVAAFAQFASELDASTRQLLDRGARLTELLKQGQYSPLTVPEQVISIYSGVNGYLDGIEISEVGSFESEAIAEIKSKHADLLEAINNEKDLSEDNAKKLKSFYDDFVARFSKK